jgi:hypothetical protein
MGLEIIKRKNTTFNPACVIHSWVNSYKFHRFQTVMLPLCFRCLKEDGVNPVTFLN